MYLPKLWLFWYENFYIDSLLVLIVTEFLWQYPLAVHFSGIVLHAAWKQKPLLVQLNSSKFWNKFKCPICAGSFHYYIVLNTDMSKYLCIA